MNLLNRFDDYLLHHEPDVGLRGFKRFVYEFWFFGVKETRACLFAGIIFLSMFIVPKTGLFHLPRYDVLLLIAIITQSYFKNFVFV